MTNTVGRLGRLLREALQLGPLALDEALPLDQVLGRVAADDLLREDADRDPVGGHVVGERQRAVGVLAKRADRGVDTAQSNSYEPHCPRLSLIPGMLVVAALATAEV